MELQVGQWLLNRSQLAKGRQKRAAGSAQRGTAPSHSSRFPHELISGILLSEMLRAEGPKR